MFHAAWSEFLAAPATLGPSPGVREAWHAGRPHYAVWVLRVEDPAILARLAGAADALAPHGVVPLHAPHVTVFVAGFPAAAPRRDDDVATRVLAAQADALRAAPPRRPRLAVGPANAFLSCPFLEVHDPHDDLAALRAPLEALHRELRYAPYLPHLTLGAFSDARPTGPVAAALAPLRALPPLPLRPDAVELVRFDARTPDGPLETLARIPLAE